MKKPVIGINSDDGLRSSLRQQYWDAIERAGGSPAVIPSMRDPEAFAATIKTLDGVLITGGLDIVPERLGLGPDEVPPSLSPMTAERDATDFALIEAIERLKLPTLGVCLGCQELNVARNGTLYTDLDTQCPRPLEHHLAPGQSAYHTVNVEAPGFLKDIWGGARKVRVNSRHHQSIREPGRGVRILAHSPDGIVEAIELDGHPFLVGVQWHPEDLVGDEHAEKLFEALVENALKYRQNVPGGGAG